MHLRDILGIDNTLERNQLLRRAFSGYTSTIDITGCEAITLTILLNLTYRKNQIDDLLDKKLAKAVLNNEDILSKCINELQWLHTHNLKYPDIRVSLQNLVVDPPVLHSSVLSSANYKKSFGWSHDSSKVNLVKLFVSYFDWQGESRCLAETLIAQPKEWKIAFQSLGMSVKSFINLCNRVQGFLPIEMIPSSVDRYSPQVRMPYHDEYIAVTPVVSHVLQASIQQVANKKQGKFNQVSFTRPAAVSELVASLGGFVNTLNYPPLTNKKHYGLHNSRLVQIQRGETVYYLKALVKTQFLKALDGLIYNGGELALKQRRQQKVINIKAIRNTLSEWLAPILEWRLDVMENSFNISELESISDTVEYQLLTTKGDDIHKLIIPLFGLLNAILSNSSLTQKYAFHPQLMPSLKAGLKWVLRGIARENITLSNNVNDEPFRYLHLKDLRVFDAQALSNPYCTGIPSLTAVWGMVHHYQRRINKALGTQLRFTSFSWFIKNYSINAGKKLPEVSLQGAKQNELRRPGLVDSKYCDLVFDIVLHIDGYEEDLLVLDEQTEMLKAKFPSTLAGGVMHPPELDLMADWCHLFTDENNLFEKLRRLPLSGRWIMPIKHKIKDLEDLMLLLANNSTLSPAMLGFILLDKPKARGASIEKLHCYAEPAIGLIEYTTAIQMRLQGKKSYFNKAFWMLDAQERFMLLKGI